MSGRARTRLNPLTPVLQIVKEIDIIGTDSDILPNQPGYSAASTGAVCRLPARFTALA
jgi:CheY-like chemotaxis protein